MNEGLTRSVYEIFEIILPVAILLLIGAGIFFVSNVDFNRAYMLEKEMSYVSSIVKEDTVIEINLKNTQYGNLNVKNTEDKIIVNIDDEGASFASGQGTSYLNNNVKIEQKNQNVVLISK